MEARHGNLKIDSENIFPIIKKWMYSDQDIFIREQISNACDAVTKLEKRLTEAANLGFKTAIVPKQSLAKINLPKEIKVYGAGNINEVINLFRRK